LIIYQLQKVKRWIKIPAILISEHGVNDSFNKVVTNDEDNGAQILNKTNNKSFLLFAPSEEYHILEEENNDAYNSENENLPFELSNETKNIAGYPCKLAIVKIDPELDDEDNMIKIWYTDKIPVLYWGQFSFLKNIPGAALEVMIGKNGFKAVDVNQENVPTNFFEIPETYTEFEMETEDEETEDSAIVADTQIDEDRFLYYDESETFLGLKDESDRQITKAEYGYFDYFKRWNYNRN
jgi:GLPGLI family protein